MRERLRNLMVLFTMVFLPNLAWADESYDIRIAGTTVTDLNKDDVLGDGKVSYNVENHKLTLYNATIIPESEDCGITYTGTADLTINLKGTNNVVKGNGGCGAIGCNNGTTSPDLTFTNGGTGTCSLQLEAVGVDLSTIEGFDNVIGLYKIEETIQGNEANTYRTTITSTILSGGSGTTADPFIIGTADDLNNFAKYINNQTIGSNVSVKLSDDISAEGLDCSSLTGFEPIGDRSDLVFTGTFDGNSKTIKNLSITGDNGAYVGIFRSFTTGMIKNLTLDNLTITGGSTSSSFIGGLVGEMDGGTIDDCTIKNSSISCLTTTSNPSVGGFVGTISDGTISNCNIVSCVIKAETTKTADSGACAIGGGIAGTTISGTVSGCRVKGTTEEPTSVSANYGEEVESIYAGALFGKNTGGSFTDNAYEYSVTTKARTTTKSGYTQRGIGNGDDVSGAVMYTRKVTFPTVTGATITKDGNYYSYDDTGINVAPGQTATMIVEPSDAIKSFTATNVDDEEISSDALSENRTRYSFVMPDAAVTVTLTMKENPNLRFNILWQRLEMGQTYSQEVLSDMETTPTVTWSSSNTAVATVDADGVVTPVAPSSSDIQITATFAGDDNYAPATKSYDISVVKGTQYLFIQYKGKSTTLARVKVTKGNSINIQTDYDLVCPEELVSSLTWTPDNSSVVTADNGVVTGLGCGSTRIVVKFAGNDNYEADTYEFYVDVAPPVPTINLAEGTYLSTHEPITITKADIANTAISYTWDDITGDNDATWKNYTDEGVALQTGTLYARVGYTPGDYGDVIYSDTVSVAYIVLIDPELTYKQGETAVTTATWTLGKENNTALPVLQNPHSVSVTYVSDNTAVATVANDGTVTAVGIGTATITATSTETDVYAAGEASYTLTVNRQLNVSFSASNEWATYYGTENLATPTGLKAYQVTAVEGATVTISAIGYIPANTAVLLQNVSNHNTWSNIAASAYTGATSTFPNNMLKGSTEEISVSSITGGTVYVLYNNMFKHATSGTIPANRGYLVVSGAAAARLNIVHGGDDTGINNIRLDETDDSWYAIDGRKLNGQPQRAGFYIRNGKKVYIKK